MIINKPNIIFDTIDCGLIMLDEKLNVIYWNKWLEIRVKISKEEIFQKNICEVFPTINEKKFKRKTKTTLLLNTPSFYNVEPNRFLIPIKLNSITNNIFENMQQKVTIVPYDIKEKIVCLYIYDLTEQSENQEKLNVALSELNKYKNELETQVEVEVEKSKSMEIENLDMKHKVFHDPLTKIFNRAKFEDVFKSEIDRYHRYKMPFCVGLLDIDHFKKFNDTFGHLIGDEVLISLAQSCNKTTRATDTFARWGGEEFVFIFANTTLEEAKNPVQNLQKAIWSIKHKTAGSITASFGVTQVKENDTIEIILKRADDSLYEAKSLGRDRYIMS